MGLLVLVGIGGGIVNVLLLPLVIGPINAGAKADEVAISTYAINFFVGWVFFSAWFLARADEEWKAVAEAALRGDLAAFLVAEHKRIPVSIRALHLIISVLTILAFHLFEIESPLIHAIVQFGVGFLVLTTIAVLWDLDEPVGGAIGVPDIPPAWVAARDAPHEHVRRDRSGAPRDTPG